jgi:hypothetical protein
VEDAAGAGAGAAQQAARAGSGHREVGEVAFFELGFGFNCGGRDEVALNKLKKTLGDLCSQRDKLQLQMNRAVEGEGEGEAERLQEVRKARFVTAFGL